PGPVPGRPARGKRAGRPQTPPGAPATWRASFSLRPSHEKAATPPRCGQGAAVFLQTHARSRHPSVDNVAGSLRPRQQFAGFFGRTDERPPLPQKVAVLAAGKLLHGAEAAVAA